MTDQKELFTYDHLNRLTNWDVHSASSSALLKSNFINYDNLGNITGRSDLNTGQSSVLNYDNSAKPHQLSTITGNPALISDDGMNITYTDFRKITNLSESGKSYTLSYGVDNQRRKSVCTDGSVTKTRYYFGNYEEERDNLGNTRKYHYLSGGALQITTNGAEALYYGYFDNQGSLIALTNENGAVVEKYAYDPTTAMFMSPDPFVTSAGNSFSFDTWWNAYLQVRFEGYSGGLNNFLEKYNSLTSKTNNNGKFTFRFEAGRYFDFSNAGGDFDGVNLPELNIVWKAVEIDLGRNAQGGEGSNYAWAGVLAFAGTAAVADGPIPFGDAIGGAVVLGYGTYVLADKMTSEITRIYEKVNNTRGFTYELRATTSGLYPNVRGGVVSLNAGDVWKYGETTQGFGRYPDKFLKMNKLEMVPIFYGNVAEIKVQEKIMIYGYYFQNGTLPPGNSIFR